MKISRYGIEASESRSSTGTCRTAWLPLHQPLDLDIAWNGYSYLDPCHRPDNAGFHPQLLGGAPQIPRSQLIGKMSQAPSLVVI